MISNRHYLTIAAGLLCLNMATAVVNADEPAAVRRIRGILDRDETWSGHILLTGNTRIENCTIRVEPGTLIEFACPDCDEPPVLSIGFDPADPEESFAARLELTGTPERPVTVRSHPRSRRGQIVWFARSPERANLPAQPPPQSWKHVRFESLGGEKTGNGSASALLLRAFADGDEPGVLLADCEFQACAPVDVQFGGDGRVQLERCRFTRTSGTIALCIGGESAGRPLRATGDPPDRGRVQLRDCRFDALLHARRSSLMLTGNRFDGNHAGVCLDAGVSADSAIRGNLVHNRAPGPESRFAFSSSAADVTVEENIFVGAAHSVYHGTRRMRGNVFVASGALDAGAAAEMPLIASLPPGAVFEHNLLIGPARTLLVAQPAMDATTMPGALIHVRNNTFDGQSRTPRGIHLNAPGRPSAFVGIENNLFLRVAEPVHVERPHGEKVALCAANAWAPSRGREREAWVPYQRDEKTDEPAGASGPVSVSFESLADLKLNGGEQPASPEWLTAAMAKNMPIDEMRRRLMAPYRPRPHSPLLGAATSTDASRCIGIRPE